MATQATDAATAPSTTEPWGITFGFTPPDDPSLPLERRELQAAEAWGKIHWALPGWEIRQIPGASRRYVAFPPASLVRVSATQEDPGEAILRRFNSLRAVPDTRDEILETDVTEDVVRRFLPQPAPGATPNDDVVRGLRLLALGDQLLAIALQRWRSGDSRLTVLQRVLGPECGEEGGSPLAVDLPPRVRSALATLCKAESRRLREIHVGALSPGVRLVRPARKETNGTAVAEPQAPAFRELRAYSFDPSLATEIATAPIHTVKIPVRWEDDLQPGPIGEYLEVIDIDPDSTCAYAPVDLNHPYVLAQDGLLPSEGNPQFHQQMVYAVAMNTIHRFEVALGRPIFWSHLRPWLSDRPEERTYFTPEALPLLRRPADEASEAAERSRRWDVSRQMRYVQRLRIYPHAKRDDNASYSPISRAIQFGYFPSADLSGRDYPGGTVFTCLSHDIIVHETTHALVDGMHPYFSEPSNPDVLAFHEAFADIMALFQHFTYPEVLRHQLANTAGNLETDNLLGQLAQQFGRATGTRGALRNYLGDVIDGKWTRTTPDPRKLDTLTEPHERGAILVSAVFDAYLDLYNDRVSDLLRIATGGTGVLPAGQIHPDLTNRLANEAAAAAEQVLRICIRAMDYVPPVDITFGEFLRALITADYDLSPLGRNNRIAFIDAFRSWGIYPRDVTTLSEESLRWRPPEPDSLILKRLEQIGANRGERKQIAADLVNALDQWQPGSSRDDVFRIMLEAQAELHRLLTRTQNDERDEVLPGLDWRRGASFSVGNLRPARRVGSQGEFRTELVVEIVQRYRPDGSQPDDLVPRRGGATLIIDLRDLKVRYIIFKRLYQTLPKDPREPGGVLIERLQRLTPAAAPLGWLAEEAGDLALPLGAAYGGGDHLRAVARAEPFALVHRGL